MSYFELQALENVLVNVDVSKEKGLYEGWRHSLGQNAVNSDPLPEKVVEAVRKLKPRLIRIFLQEYFDVYPDHGVFKMWDKEKLELLPFEVRKVDVLEEFAYQFYCPADSVVMFVLEDINN